MDENKNKREYSFIRERIRSPKKARRVILTIVIVILLGALGGVVAGLVFSVTKNLFTDPNTVYETKREVILVHKGDVDEGEEGEEGSEEASGEAEGSEEESGTSEPAEPPAVTLKSVAEKVSGSLFQVTVVLPAGEDWFREAEVRERETVGLPVGESDEAVYLLTDGSQWTSEARIRVAVDGQILETGLYGMDPVTRIALIEVPKIYIKHSASMLPYAPSDSVKTGDRVFVFGTLYGRYLAMDEGIVAYLEQTEIVTDGYEQLIFTNAERMEGSSAVLFNESGEVLGFASDASSGDNSHAVSAYGIHSLTTVLNALLREEKLPYLGVLCRTFTNAELRETGRTAGLYVREVSPGSPAEAAGIQAGDRLISLDGRPVSNIRGLQRIMNSLKAGAESYAVVGRQNNGTEEAVRLDLTLGER